MRFKAFKNFSIGKPKEKNKTDRTAAEEEPISGAPEIGDNKKEPGGDLSPELGDPADIILGANEVPVRPHGPAAELSVEPEEQDGEAGIKLDELDDDASIKLREAVKTGEVSAEKAAALKEAPVAAAPAPAEEKKEAKTDDSDSLNNLFSTDEEEENPLASLIDSLPDVTVQELMEDLEEIQRIIKEWRPG
jgi:hypothetical protein